MKYYAIYDLKHNELSKSQVIVSGNDIESIEIEKDVFDDFEKYKYSNGKIIINENYENELQIKNNNLRKAEIQEKLKELDNKRIRSLCEPSLKDSETTWLEYYNNQVQDLREEYSKL